MNLKAAIFEQLKNDPAISAIVGQRIYRTFAPQGKGVSQYAPTPFITYQRIETKSKNDIDLITEIFQFDLLGKKEDDDVLENLKEKLLDNLNRFKGDLGSTGFDVKGVFLEVVADEYNEDNSMRRIVVSFRFVYLK